MANSGWKRKWRDKCIQNLFGKFSSACVGSGKHSYISFFYFRISILLWREHFARLFNPNVCSWYNCGALVLSVLFRLEKLFEKTRSIRAIAWCRRRERIWKSNGHRRAYKCYELWFNDPDRRINRIKLWKAMKRNCFICFQRPNHKHRTCGGLM